MDLEYEKKILEASMDPKKMVRYGTIDYSIFRLNNQEHLWVHGTNEPMDWKYNLLGFLPDFEYHPGYDMKSKELKKLIDLEFGDEPFVLCGHSMGASICLVYASKHPGQYTDCIAFAPAVTHAFWNKKKPAPGRIYFRSWDIVRLSQFFFPYKLPLKVIKIKDKNISGLIKDHKREAYIDSLQ